MQLPRAGAVSSGRRLAPQLRHHVYKIPEPERGKPWHFKYLTVNHVYYPLARGSGKIYALLQAHKARGGDRAKKLFQFLNEIGAPVPSVGIWAAC